MRTVTRWTRLATAAAIISLPACKSLEVTNPNAPDAARAFNDPGAVAGLVTGAIRNWYNTRGAYWGALTMSAMADSYSASWNNADLRYYSSYGPIGSGGADCPQRCGWDNTPSGAHRLAVESFWYSYYSMLSSVNDVLTAIRVNGVDLGGAEATALHEAAAVMVQGIVFANIALDYDKGFVVTEATDLADPTTLPFLDRTVMRDSAIAKFNQAIALFQALPPSAESPTTWTGPTSTFTYTGPEFIKLIRTMQAEVLADFARDATENAATNWAQVATFASAGLSSGTSQDFNFFQDVTVLYDWVKAWGNSVGTARVDTRVARLVTGGYAPALGTGPIYRDPYPNVPEPQPNSADKRVGNGSWGPEDDVTGNQSVAADAGAGSDFAWVPAEILNPARGLYHRSSLGHIRYTYLASPGSGLPGETGTGPNALYSATQNDLLWAEGLLRSGGSATLAASLINKTRVGRGGLAPLTGTEGTAALLLAMQYEQEVEEMGFWVVPFHNRRRQTPAGWTTTQACPGILCMWPNTPRHMPVPAKELSVLQQELYSFGGPTDPEKAPSFQDGVAIFSARRIGEAMLKAQRPSEIGRRKR